MRSRVTIISNINFCCLDKNDSALNFKYEIKNCAKIC